MEAISDKGQKILLTADNTGKKLPNSDKKKCDLPTTDKVMKF